MRIAFWARTEFCGGESTTSRSFTRASTPRRQSAQPTLRSSMRESAASPEPLTSEASSPAAVPIDAGRVLCIGGDLARGAAEVLRTAGYAVECVESCPEPDTLVRAATGFGPDVIYVSLMSSEDGNLSAIRELSLDRRTAGVPLIALVRSGLDAGAIEAIYARVGCDFVPRGRSDVLLLARTELLIRLSRTRASSRVAPEIEPPKRVEEPGGADGVGPEASLYSAAYFFRRLPSELARTRRYGRPLALLAVFCPGVHKRANAAVRVADALQRTLRQCDVSARVDEDLFVCMLPETRSHDALQVEQRLTQALDRHDVAFGIGAVSTDACPSTITPHELLGRARCGAQARCRQ
ncbi:MAG: diguanylate cyclase [Myxococcales bacterium FL481]|nr:MAG: diguanylate cyclase [Myxococcales bacterium FL481]